jgi:hypothetical protein
MNDYLETDVYIADNFYQNLRINRISQKVNAQEDKIVVSADEPNNADGRPDGTIYFKVS